MYKNGEVASKNYSSISFCYTAHKVKNTNHDLEEGSPELFTVNQFPNEDSGRTVYQRQVDFHQAYDSLWRDKLYSIMLGIRIPTKLIN